MVINPIFLAVFWWLFTSQLPLVGVYSTPSRLRLTTSTTPIQVYYFISTSVVSSSSPFGGVKWWCKMFKTVTDTALLVEDLPSFTGKITIITDFIRFTNNNRLSYLNPPPADSANYRNHSQSLIWMRINQIQLIYPDEADLPQTRCISSFHHYRVNNDWLVMVGMLLLGSDWFNGFHIGGSSWLDFSNYNGISVKAIASRKNIHL